MTVGELHDKLGEIDRTLDVEVREGYDGIAWGDVSTVDIVKIPQGAFTIKRVRIS